MMVTVIMVSDRDDDNIMNVIAPSTTTLFKETLCTILVAPVVTLRQTQKFVLTAFAYVTGSQR